MLSPVIKINKFDSHLKSIDATLSNLDYNKRYKIEFSNLNFDSVNERVEISSGTFSDINNVSEIKFSYKIKSDEDKFLYCQIYEWDIDGWKSSHIATSVFKEDDVVDSKYITVDPIYVGHNDKINILVSAKPNHKYDVIVGKNSFTITTNNVGKSSLHINAINAVDYKTFSQKFVKKYTCSLIDSENKQLVENSFFEFVPEHMYALAATNDPDRPSCVILDPDPVAAFSVATEPFDSPCFVQPLVGSLFTSDGASYGDVSRLDPDYKNCNDGYVSSALSVVNSSCKIYNKPKFVNLNVFDTNARKKIKSLYTSGETSISENDFIHRNIGFVYSSCDENASDINNPVDPCSFSSQEIKKIPRIFLGCTTGANKIKVHSLARGILKAPPAYFHSALIGKNGEDDVELSDGDIVNIIFDLSNGSRISKSLEYSDSTHGNISAFVEALASEISSDSNIVNANISVRPYPDLKRIDFTSDTKFIIFAGQVNFIDSNTGDYKKNNKVLIVRDSKYTFDFEITSPSDYDDIKNVLNSGGTHMVFLDGQFKGLTVSINKTITSGVITLDTCPRVSVERRGLGAFIVSDDIYCTHVAFISKDQLVEDSNATKLSALPFLRNNFNEVIPSSHPCITANGQVLCQGLIDGKWQIFGYFPGLPDSSWLQLTSNGENRNPSAASDSEGNIHIAWETDRFGYTTIQYGCIGPSSKLINRLALSGLISRQISDELVSKIFDINPIGDDVNFIESSSSNITLLPEIELRSLVAGAEISGGSFRIAREFTGNVRIDDDEFSNLAQVPASFNKFGAIRWADGAPPDFYNGSYCTSYIVHFQQNGTGSGSTVSASFSASFNGKILRVFLGPNQMSRSNKVFRSTEIIYPAVQSGDQISNFVSNASVIDGEVEISGDGKTLIFSMNYRDLEQIGPMQLRVLVDGVKSQNAVDQSSWNRIFSNNGKVSVPENSQVCVECSPKFDCAIASLSVYENEAGIPFDGQEREINLSVHADCSIGPPGSDYIVPIGDTTKPSSENHISLIERSAPPFNVFNETVIWLKEFSGESGFSQGKQFSSEYRNYNNYFIVTFEDQSNKYFNGFTNTDHITSFTLSLYFQSGSSALTKEVAFGQEILSLYVSRLDLENTDITLGNGAVTRAYILEDSDIKILVNSAKNKLTFQIPPNTQVDFTVRAVVSSQNFVNPFIIKDHKEIDSLFVKFINQFTQQNDNSYLFDNNKFSIGKTEKRYDNLIPLLGTLRFDDLNINANAISANFANLSTIQNSAEDIDSFSCADVSSINTYELIDQFNIDGSDSHLGHSYVGIIPERVSFIAKNNETLDEYSIRTGSVAGYREAVIKDVYTGYAKACLIINGASSAGKATSFALGTVFVVSDYANIDISSNFKLQLDANYLRLGKTDKLLINKWSHISNEAFYQSSEHKLNYHLMCNVFVDDRPILSHNAQVDLSDKNRQWDICFGSPFGSYPVCRNGNSSFLDFISATNWELNFNNIRVGSPRMVIASEASEVSAYTYSSPSLVKPVPNSDSNTKNEIFSESLIDPGDWVCLEDSSLLVDQWSAESGGCVYVGSYAKSASGFRSILLESCVPYSQDIINLSYRLYPQIKTRRGRISTGSGGGLSQVAGTLYPNESHKIYITTGLRQLPENLPRLVKTILVQCDADVFAYRHPVVSGRFASSLSALDYKTFRSDFIPSSSNFNVNIRNVSDNLSSSFAHFYISYNGTGWIDNFTGPIDHTNGSTYGDSVFYIDQDGVLGLYRGYNLSGGISSEANLLNPDDPLKIVAVDSSLHFNTTVNQNDSAIAVTSDGDLVTFTYDGSETDIPSFMYQANLPADSNYVNVSIGWTHGCALKKDGTVTCWGDDTYGQVSGQPSGVKFVQIKAGKYFTVGLKENGEIAVWGRDNHNQVTNKPSGKFVKIDAGSDHAVAIGFDGYPVSWGKNVGIAYSASIRITDPQTKLIDVAACGGDVYNLNTYASSTPGSSVLTTTNPFNVGIDVDGNVVAWGPYATAFTPTGREGTHSSPSVPCVAVKKGIKNALLLGVDGKIYSYGISYCPSDPSDVDAPSNVSSIYKTDLDFISGGLLVSGVDVYSVSNLVEEEADVENFRLLGMTSNNELLTSYGLPYLASISGVPISWNNGDLQKSPSCMVDRFDKLSIVWEDNGRGPWGVALTSNIWLNRSFTDKVYLSERSYSGINPAVSSDSSGKRIVVWESIKNEKHFIECASHVLHPDYVSECDIDKIVKSSRELGIDPDPYDPYNVEKSLMSCKVEVSFTAPEFGNYFFTIKFKDYINENIIYKTASSRSESGKWFINGKNMPFNGQVIAQGETIVLSYVPDANDDVFNKVLKVDIGYSIENEQEEVFITYKAPSITEGRGYGWWDIPSRSYPIEIKSPPAVDFINEFLVFDEAAINAPVSVSEQKASYFESIGSSKDTNFIFPTGIDSLPGFSAGDHVKSFLLLLGDDGLTTNNVVEGTLTFSAPIVAVIVDSANLAATDNYFNDASRPIVIQRKGLVSNFQFYQGEYIRLSEDRKSLSLRFKQPRRTSWPSIPGGVTSTKPGAILTTDDTIVSVDVREVSGLLVAPSDLVVFGGADEAFGSVGPLVAGLSANARPYGSLRIIVSNTGSATGQITTTYFCASPIINSCKINMSYRNDSTEVKNVHFKVSVFADSNYTDSLMVFSSLSDPRMWSSGNDVYPTAGLGIAPSSNIAVNFSPPTIDVQNFQIPVDQNSVNEQSRVAGYGNYFNLSRSSLICGVRYYIIAESIVDGNASEIFRSSLLCPCREELSYKEDAFEWRSPLNGSNNTIIAMSNYYIGHPSVVGGKDGLFAIVWEDSRSSQNSYGIINKNIQQVDLYCGFFDTNRDIIESAYHGGIDRLLVNNSNATDKNILDCRMPHVAADDFGNFSIFANVGYNKIIKRYLSVGSKITPNIIEESANTKACSFTLTDVTRYATAFDGGEFMQARVAERFVKSYKSIASSDSAPVVNDCFIDLEVIGIPGAMAFRIKNESESDFTDWIPIGMAIQPLDSVGKEISEDASKFREAFKGKWIANDIFIAPWVLSKGDGVKRVCLEVLTQFGKTQQFCLDIIAEYSSMSYVVEVFYVESGKTEKLFKPIKYKGIPVVNRKTWYKSAENNQTAITLSLEDLRTIDLSESTEVDLYVQVTFEDSQRISRLNALNQIASYADRRKDSGSMKAYLYQQGSRVYRSVLNPVANSDGVYYATFKIKKNNGATDKDGLGFIFIDVPSECLNPFVKKFINTLRLLSDPGLDRSYAEVIDQNAFIERYVNTDKRNAFGSRRLF